MKAKFIPKQDEKQLLFITWHLKNLKSTGNTVSVFPSVPLLRATTLKHLCIKVAL